MDVYLDIDGTIKSTAAPLEDVVEFVEYCLNYHQVYWLTTNCRNFCNRTYEVLDFLPDDLRNRTLEIRATNWNVLKTDGIDFDRGKFLWFDDQILVSERRLLLIKNADRSFYKIETQNPQCMKDALEYLKLYEQEKD